ncbi:MAG: GspE/PulE family protein [bacterium]
MPNGIQSIEDLIRASRGQIKDDQSAQAKFAAKQIQISVKDKEKSAAIKAASLGLPYMDLFAFPMSPEGLVLIPEEQSIAQSTVCFYFDGGSFRVATTNPTEQTLEIISTIEAKTFAKGQLYFISERSLKYALDMYKIIPKVDKTASGVKIEAADLERFKEQIVDYRSLNEMINTVSISDIVTLLIATALKVGTSDIHIEAEERGTVVRLRIDGILQEAAVIDREKWPRIISRMKLLAKVKLNVTGKPQDGRYNIEMPDEKIAVRCSFLPTSFGESVVMRLLKSSSVGLPFEELGMSARAFEILGKEIEKPNGLILTTGPTGSGKTTTLYAILNKINQPGVKIITLEDPVEFQLPGVNQSQVDASKNYTFANGLRSILRQDPDVVMVGEIRDLETAEISVQAALTGHLVLSTLHTNDASGVIPRLIDMGVKPYFLTPSINAVIGQRLVRKLCNSCKVEDLVSEEDSERVNKILAVISPNAGVDIPAVMPKLYKVGPGCDKCKNSGFKGRVGIYEIFTMSDDLKQLTADGAPAFKIMQKAIENGMVTMLQDGVLKAMAGQTSLEEIYRVIGKFDYIDALYDVVVSNTVGRGVKIKADIYEQALELSKNLINLGSALEATPTKQMLDLIFAVAIRVEAGDVHIDPTEHGVKVRFRIDGVMNDIVKLGKEHYIPLMSNIKSLAGFSMSEKRPTYDGRFSITVAEKNMDCRLSIISGGYGETAVIRVLANEAANLDMEKLGINDAALMALKRSIKKTKGMIVTTGPTGSGKTTTLYSVLNKLNSSYVKIITIEDPIEYHLEGIMQTQIDTAGGYTFAAALRSLMRQNPNVIMVGEIRDDETAKTAVEAAMTGHLMLSTIHANSAAGAIARFVGLGVERQALASSLECVVGQRLVRRICTHCKVSDELSSETKTELEVYLTQMRAQGTFDLPAELKFFKGAGCAECGGIGYKGRVGLYEVIEMSPDIQKIIQQENVTDHDIEEAAMKNGTVLMLQYGIMKALSGETSISEVFRTAK